MKIYNSTQITADDIIRSASYDDIIEFIINIDELQNDWEFTIEALNRWLDNLIPIIGEIELDVDLEDDKKRFVENMTRVMQELGYDAMVECD